MTPPTPTKLGLIIVLFFCDRKVARKNSQKYSACNKKCGNTYLRFSNIIIEALGGGIFWSPILKALDQYISGIQLLNLNTAFMEKVNTEEQKFNHMTVY